MAKNTNPTVHRGTCVDCGGEVVLFDQDADEYLAAPHRGLRHIVCPVDDDDEFTPGHLVMLMTERCPVCGGVHP